MDNKIKCSNCNNKNDISKQKQLQYALNWLTRKNTREDEDKDCLLFLNLQSLEKSLKKLIADGELRVVFSEDVRISVAEWIKSVKVRNIERTD